MSGGANIVEQYAGADVPARIELLIKYYPNFIRLVEGYEQSLTTNYFWGQDVEMSQFYRVPKALYTGEYFRGISFEAKAIYGMMIDRVSLSIKNGWLDEDGKTYIHYSVADIMADTGCGKNKILKCLKELEEDVRLIERKKQGQGRPKDITRLAYGSAEIRGIK